MNGKRIVIVGATSGIGREVALQYIKKGYQVGVAGRRMEQLEALRAMAKQQVFVQRIDVTDEKAKEQLLSLIRQMGGMDVFLLCAGIGHQNRCLTTEVEMRTLQTNVEGFTRMVLAAYHYFSGQGGGHIAAISSIAGTKGLGAAPAYSATKRFQSHYLDALAQLSHIDRRPITFTDIRPGFVSTALLNDGLRYPMCLSPRYAARLIVRAIDRRQRRAIIDWRYALLVFFWRLIPEWLWERLPIVN